MKTINVMNLIGAESEGITAHGLKLTPTKGPSLELTKEEVYLYQLWVATLASGIPSKLVLKSYTLVLPETLELTEGVCKTLQALLITGNDQPVSEEDTVVFELNGERLMGRYDASVFIVGDKDTHTVTVKYFKETPDGAKRPVPATGWMGLLLDLAKAQVNDARAVLHVAFEAQQVSLALAAAEDAVVTETVIA